MMSQVGEMIGRYAPGKPFWVSEVGCQNWGTYQSQLAGMAPSRNLSALAGASFVARNLIEARRAGVTRYFSYTTSGPVFGWRPQCNSARFTAVRFSAL